MKNPFLTPILGQNKEIVSEEEFESSTNGLKGQDPKHAHSVQEPALFCLVHWTTFIKVSQRGKVQWTFLYLIDCNIYRDFAKFILLQIRFGTIPLMTLCIKPQAKKVDS